MKKSGYVTSLGERASYGIYYFSQNIFYAFVTTFIATYLLNSGLSEELIAAVLIAPKIWDAVNDPIFGVIVDKLKFKKGRFMPWIRLSVIFIPLATAVLFMMPSSIPQWAKITWVVLGYVFWDSAYTMCDAPIFALATTMSPDPHERTAILSMSRITGTLGAFAPMIAVPMMYGENGLGLGFGLTAVIVSLIGFVLMLPICFTVKERSHAVIEEAPSISELMKNLFSNKFLLIFYCGMFVMTVTNGVQVLIPVFCQYVLGNETLATGLLVAAMAPALIVALIMPALSKRIDKFYIYIASIAAFAVVSVVQYFVGYENMAALYAVMIFRGIGLGGTTVLGFLFTPDCVEYGHYKTGSRNEGVCFSLQTFITKIVSAIVTSLSMVVIGALGFSSANVTPEGKNGVWLTFTVLSAVGAFIALPIFLCGYKLRDKDVRLMALCNNGEISREECESRLSDLKKYY